MLCGVVVKLLSALLTLKYRVYYNARSFLTLFDGCGACRERKVKGAPVRGLVRYIRVEGIFVCSIIQTSAESLSPRAILTVYLRSARPLTMEPETDRRDSDRGLEVNQHTAISPATNPSKPAVCAHSFTCARAIAFAFLRRRISH